MLLRAILDIVALLIAFALGVIFARAVRGALGLLQEDLHVEVGLMRSDLAQLSKGVEERLKAIEEHLERR